MSVHGHQFALPPPENYSGAVSSRFFYRLRIYPRENRKSSIVQIKRSRINCKVLATLPVEKPIYRRRGARSPNADWIEILWENRPVLVAKSGPFESVLVYHLLVCTDDSGLCNHKRRLFCLNARWRVSVLWLGQLFIMFTITTLKHLDFRTLTAWTALFLS